MERDEQWGRGGKRVVVIGGGIGGSLVAKTLQFHCDLTLIDPKEYFEIAWAGLRSMVEPSFAKRAVIHHKDYLTNGNLVVSSAINITDHEVLTAEGHHVAYDYLVIATGHDVPFPRTRPERLEQYERDNEKIKSADSILITGGGPVGVELAAEIATDYPDKKLTLVHNGPRLLEFIGPKASKKALDWLILRNVDVKLETSVNVDNIMKGSSTYVTSSRQTIHADCHFLCAGTPLGSIWLKRTILKDSLDKLGRVKVDERLRVLGHRNIFAIGDVTDVQEIKQGYLARRHANVVVKNLKLLMEGGHQIKLEKYRPGSAMAVVSLGRNDAVGEFPFATMGGFLPGLFKSKDLFVGKTRKQMGLQP